jgi:putative DNA-invertase from lambdoid prophage Rac
MMRAALYARVSHRDQKTVPDQLADLRAYCERQGWTVTAEFSDVISGRKNSRPERNELIQQSYKGRFDVVVVWRLDRWSRSAQDALNTLAELDRIEVSFVSLQEKLDFSTPIGRAMVRILAVFAELDRETIAERTKAGLERAKARGMKMGRPPSARGKTKMVLYLAEEGKNNSEIAKECKISRASVIRIRRANGISTHSDPDQFQA